MTASNRGSRAAASLLRSTSRRQTTIICGECLSHLPRSLIRSYAVETTSIKTNDASIPPPALVPPVTTSPIREYIPKAGLLLSRPPLLTAPLSSFEKAFFFYQKRLNERLAMPFPRYFYFKKDTPADTDWKIKARERNGTPARELGGYRAYGEEAWNDEILEGEKGIEGTKYMIESLVRDSRVRAVEGKDGKSLELEEGSEEQRERDEAEGQVRVLSRFTKADWGKEYHRLDRRLERTLYLVVKRKEGGWGFPAGTLEGRENLHQAAERILVQTAGSNMNTWIVGHVPVGHHTKFPRYEDGKSGKLEEVGEKTFFMKGRIMAGQANLTHNKYGLEDFRWLTREEIERVVAARYWSFVKNMLGDR